MTDEKKDQLPITKECLGEPGTELATLKTLKDHMPTDPNMRVVRYLMAVDSVYDAAARAGNWSAQLSALKLSITTTLMLQRKLRREHAPGSTPDGEEIQEADFTAMDDEALRKLAEGK